MCQSPAHCPWLWFSDSAEKNVPAMPGSPVDGKTHSRPTVSVMPPLPSINPSGPRPAAFSTTAREPHSNLHALIAISVSHMMTYYHFHSIYIFCMHGSQEKPIARQNLHYVVCSVHLTFNFQSDE